MKKKKQALQSQEENPAMHWRQLQRRKLEENGLLSRHLSSDAQHLAAAFDSLLAKFSEEHPPDLSAVFMSGVETLRLRREEIDRKIIEELKSRGATHEGKSGFSDLDAIALIGVSEAAGRVRAEQIPTPDDKDFTVATFKLERVIEKLCDLTGDVGRAQKATTACQEELEKKMAGAVDLLDGMYSDLRKLSISRSWGVQKSQPSKKTRQQQGQSKRRRP